MTKDPLSPQQAQALFDILTHHEVYSEIERFKYPEAIQNYGHPFPIEDGAPSTSPILQSLFARFILELPGVKSVAPEFWRNRCKVIVEKLGAAELSESYDKGAIGSRRTLATAVSTIIEYPARGCLGGVMTYSNESKEQEYDISDADDVIRAWEHFCQELIHGQMVDNLFDVAMRTDKLEEHSPLVQAAHEYMLVNLASFLHYIMVHSPDGPYLARVLENVHKLIPYMTLRQALRIGNAATMVNAVVRLVLAKISVTSLTNWIGISNSADEGMNLLQQIASTVIGWDINDLSKQASKKEKHKDAPSKEYFDSIKDHMWKPREHQENVRFQSRETSKSILAIIFEQNSLDPHSLSEEQYELLQDFLSVNLSMKDRKAIEAIICQQNPDVLTHAIRDLVEAYDPIIRGIHNAYDLSSGLSDLQNFLDDLIQLGKPPSASNNDKFDGISTPLDLPKVEDYVGLLRKHIPSVHRFLHSVAKNGGDVTEQYREYVKKAITHFRPSRKSHSHHTKLESSSSSSIQQGAAGAMTSYLSTMVSELAQEQRTLVLRQLDDYFAYLTAIDCLSRDRLRVILSESSDEGTRYGPGLYLARWQNLIDSTPITPMTPVGPVRSGRDISVRSKAGIDVSGERKIIDLNLEEGVPEAPDVSKIVELLGPKFRELLDDASRKSLHHDIHGEIVK